MLEMLTITQLKPDRHAMKNKHREKHFIDQALDSIYRCVLTWYNYKGYA